MKIDKAEIIDLLRSRGDDDQAAQAESELPQEVDIEQDAGLLEKFGVSPEDLLGRLPGGLGGLAGGFG
jgi:hypothetical protein